MTRLEEQLMQEIKKLKQENNVLQQSLIKQETFYRQKHIEQILSTERKILDSNNGYWKYDLSDGTPYIERHGLYQLFKKIRNDFVNGDVNND